MRYSLVNGERTEAQPNLSGQCQACGHLTISKCGKIKIWHWAHSGKRICDQWWENETEWHRNWKNCFPVDWQEFTQQDKNGERHIADVMTAHGWVLEFQHSFLNSVERRSRNAFYKKLAWVVNGMRRIRDKSQFFKLLNESNLVSKNPQVRKVYLDECSLLKEWSGIHAPVFFDFGEEILWCLLPASQNIWGYVVAFPRHEFIDLHSNHADQTSKNFEDCLKQLNELANLITQYTLQRQEQERSVHQTLGFQRLVRPRRHFRF